MPIWLTPEERQRVLAHARNIGIVDADAAGTGAFKAGQQQHEAGLAGAGWPYQANGFSGRYG